MRDSREAIEHQTERERHIRHLILGFALVSLLAGLIVHNSSLDRMWMVWAHQQARLPESFWLFMTQWGDSAQALVLLTAVFMYAPVNMAITLKTWLMGAIAAPLLKNLIDTPRPFAVLDPQWLLGIGHPPQGGHSLPSGHAMAAAAMGCLLVLGLDRRRSWLRLACVLACTLVALSRVAVGAHWPGDVLVGAGLGCLLVLVAERWERLRPWSGSLALARMQWGLMLLMSLLVWTIWQAPSEGPGMNWARLAILFIGVVSMVGVGLRQLRKNTEKAVDHV